MVSLEDLERESKIAYCLNRCLPERETLPPKAAVAKLTALGAATASLPDTLYNMSQITCMTDSYWCRLHRLYFVEKNQL